MKSFLGAILAGLLVLTHASGCAIPMRDNRDGRNPPDTTDGADTTDDTDATDGSETGGSNPTCDNPAPHKCPCKKNADCGEKGRWVCLAGVGECSPICRTYEDCDLDEVCEDAQCQPPGCGGDAECSGGKQCISGICEMPVDQREVASCVVLPRHALLHEGEARTFTVLAKDAGGRITAYTGDVTWRATGGTASGASVSAVVTGGVAETAIEVGASIGEVLCDKATGFNYAAIGAGELRVVVASAGDQKPVSGATVVVGGETRTTDTNGAIRMPLTAGKKTISVFHTDHAYATLVDVRTNDIAVFLDQQRAPGRLTGEMGARRFDRLSDRGQTMHVALHGTALPGNPFDVETESLFGDLVDTEIDFGGKIELPLPEGTVIGIGDNMLRKEFSAQAPPGQRTVWGIAGNAEMNKVTAHISDMLSAGDVPESLASAFLFGGLSLMNRHQSAVSLGLEVASGETKALRALSYDTLSRVKVETTLGGLGYRTGGEERQHSGVLLIGGAWLRGQGFVPLGLSRALDRDADGQVDAEGPSAPAGSMTLRLAPRHGGLETSEYALLALAGDATRFLSPRDPQAPMVLSGRVMFPGELRVSRVNQVQFGSFLPVPENPAFDGRTFKRGNPVAGADVQRLDLGRKRKWSIWFPTDVAEFAIPDVPTGFVDRFSQSEDGKSPRAVVRSISLKREAGPFGYEDVVRFNGIDMDDLSHHVDAFSALEVMRP